MANGGFPRFRAVGPMSESVDGCSLPDSLSPLRHGGILRETAMPVVKLGEIADVTLQADAKDKLTGLIGSAEWTGPGPAPSEDDLMEMAVEPVCRDLDDDHILAAALAARRLAGREQSRGEKRPSLPTGEVAAPHIAPPLPDERQPNHTPPHLSPGRGSRRRASPNRARARARPRRLTPAASGSAADPARPRVSSPAGGAGRTGGASAWPGPWRAGRGWNSPPISRAGA